MLRALERMFICDFASLIDPDINLLKYNFTVALPISRRGILKKYFCLGDFSKISSHRQAFQMQLQYCRILYYYVHIYIHNTYLHI
jgi:hypothetical protein